MELKIAAGKNEFLVKSFQRNTGQEITTIDRKKAGECIDILRKYYTSLNPATYYCVDYRNMNKNMDLAMEWTTDLLKYCEENKDEILTIRFI